MIDPHAIIDPGARLADDVTVGAYSIIGADVEIGPGSWIGPHVVIKGPTRIGRDNKIYQFASIGDDPQDKKYAGEPTRLEIGDRNVIRECCTINRGTVQDKGVTRIGNDNWIMAYVHIAHDCQLGNQIILANNASLAGHVSIDDFAILGGFTLVHQFCAIGAHSFSAMGSAIAKDVPPYLMVSGQMAVPHGLNTEGLKRQGFTPQAMQALRQAYKTLYRSNLTLEQAKEALRGPAAEHAEVRVMLDFLERVTRGIVR
ncbi:MAG: acyl-[acyl-carrier-protein]--UDP-N-acetylglucosamine O-acyltransferase [Gammaproteobacteria bacterium RBG_16_57_12]|nr:MAG: acyl-[acyl-carrier-protein]--UDP-N-acetylglucosamine O-acyltransferase [Gammaproteobacteria bacterium RBG_16_57_12]